MELIMESRQSRPQIDNGDVFWRLDDGTIHRENKPAVLWKNGDTEWWCMGKRHREGGPAVEWMFDSYTTKIGEHRRKEWWFHGKRHRLDGPALWTSDDANQTTWRINGHKIDDVAYQQWLQDMGIDIHNLNEYDISVILMVWGNGDKDVLKA